MKLMVLDGNSIVNRAYYGIKLLTTKDGRFTNGIYGFINILNKLLDMEKPDGVAVAFDLRAPTFRHQKYAEYKAGRKGMPDELAEQMPVLKQLLTYLGYHCLECEGYEADDILGTLAFAAKESGNSCVIATGDRDSLQLIGDHVEVLLAGTKMGRPEITRCDTAYIKEKYGVDPAGMIEIKALMGDSSDNIPGVPGVGEKTALDLIGRFGSLEYIYDHIDTIDVKPGVRTKLAAGKDSAFLSRELGTICLSVPVSKNLEAYRPAPQQDDQLAHLLADLEFFKLMEKMKLTAGSVRITSDTKDVQADAYEYIEDIQLLLKQSREGTVDLILWEDKAGIAAGKKIFLLDLLKDRDTDILYSILSDESIAKRVREAKPLYRFCLERGIDCKNITFDTSLAGYLVSPSATSYETDRLADEYGVTVPAVNGIDNSEDAMSESQLTLLDIGKPAVDVKAAYVLKTALHSAVCDRMEKEIDLSGFRNLLTDIEIPLSLVLADMELTGFLIDVEGIRKEGSELGAKLGRIEAEIYDLVGYEFNLNSPKQLGEALFVKLALTKGKKTKTGYSTNAEVLESLKYEHPAVDLLLQYRTLSKLKSTYCDGLPKTADENGRIHSTLNQTETRTGRISSTEPNLQNIPVRSEEGRRLRKFFMARPGMVLCDADYSQIELRVLAHMANDQAMIDAFNNNVDIHSLTASQVFGMPDEVVTPLMRSRAKAVNFGIVYGIGAFSLSKDIGVTRAEADDYIKGYFATYPGVRVYMDKVVEDAKRDGYVTTLFDRRRYLPELASSNFNMRSFGERVARNMPIQGTAADIIKIAMIRVYNRLKKEKLDAKLILQVHDELIVESAQQDKEAVCRILSEEMEGAAKMAVPLLSDVHTGETWYDAKG